MNTKYVRSLLLRALGAIENPADLNDAERAELVEDLQVEADALDPDREPRP